MNRISIILLAPDAHDYLFGMVTKVEIFETEEKINCLIRQIKKEVVLVSDSG
jgi:D-Tyr-tRNAtyr deacylase